MTEKLWRELNISTEHALRKDFVFPDKKSGHGVHWKYKPLEIFTEEWYNSFKEKIKFEGDATVILFFCEKLETNDYAHVDINEKHYPVTSVPAAFNWVSGGEGSAMVWYDRWGFTEKDLWYGKTENEWKELDPHRRAPGAAIWFVDKLLPEIARLKVPEDHVTLVNTGVAHRIELGPEDRWCFSIRPPFKAEDDWNSYVEMSKDAIIQ